MHIGENRGKSKTDTIFFLGRGRLLLPEHTSSITFEGTAYTTFTKKLTYLGSIIHSSLTDGEDIENVIL